MAVAVLRDRWDSHLRELFSGARESAIICAPFIGSAGAECVCSSLTGRSVSLLILTDLSPGSIAQGATSAAAVLAIARSSPNAAVSHLPRIHAKVYVADSSRAVVCSANLTTGGLRANIEYGLRASDPRLVRAIDSELREYAALGARMSDHTLQKLADGEAELKRSFRRHLESARAAARKAYHRLLEQAETEVLRSRLAGGALHTVFARTVEYLLRRYGPMTTPQIHQRVQSIHPDLCDDSIDRVIDGVHFGKKWKHAVRTSQQMLKRGGIIRRQGRVWMVC